MSTGEFKKKFSLEQRKDEAERILKRYPDKIPVIVEKMNKNDIIKLDKQKFLIPADMPVHNFMGTIRKRIELKDCEAMFLMVNNTMVPSNKLLSEMYEEHRDEDKFLYFVYGKENTFG